MSDDFDASPSTLFLPQYEHPLNGLVVSGSHSRHAQYSHHVPPHTIQGLGSVTIPVETLPTPPPSRFDYFGYDRHFNGHPGTMEDPFEYQMENPNSMPQPPPYSASFSRNAHAASVHDSSTMNQSSDQSLGTQRRRQRFSRFGATSHATRSTDVPSSHIASGRRSGIRNVGVEVLEESEVTHSKHNDHHSGHTSPTRPRRERQPMAFAEDRDGHKARPHSLDVLICDICEVSFSGIFKRGNLNRHNRNTHASTPNIVPPNRICRRCGLIFQRTDARKKHEWKQHRIIDSKPEKRKGMRGRFDDDDDHSPRGDLFLGCAENSEIAELATWET